MNKYLIMLIVFVILLAGNDRCLCQNFKYKSNDSIAHFVDYRKLISSHDSIENYKYIKTVQLGWTPWDTVSLNWDTVAFNLLKIEKIKALELFYRKLNTFPRALTMLNSIEELDLRLNNIKIFPKEVSKMYNVKTIDIGSNKLGHLSFSELDSLFISLSYFPNIETLRMSNNDLDTIPNSILLLKNLKRLGISRNNINQFPEILIHMDKLVDITIDCYLSLFNTFFLKTLDKKISVFLLKINTDKFKSFSEKDYIILQNLYPNVDFW